MKNYKTENIFTNKIFVVIFALTAVFLWGCAYPLIKIGFNEFNIQPNDTGGKILFAGIRFFISGIVTIIISMLMKNKLYMDNKKLWFQLIIFGLVNTALHYFCFYIGVSNCSGAKASILDSLGTFLLVIFSCAIFKSERMTINRVIGCSVGFIGILIINLGNNSGSPFSFGGDGMMILNAVCSATGGIITRFITQKMNAITATGYSLLFGGVMLIITGIFLGGRITRVTIFGVLVLAMLVIISAVGFSLYNQLICYNSVGEIAIYNSLIPIFGTVLSCVFLHENFYIRYVMSGILIALGVYIVNMKRNSER